MAFLPLITVLSMCAGCVAYSDAAGPATTKDYNFKDFSEVEIGGFVDGWDADIAAADNYSVSITMPENLTRYLSVSQLGQTLRIATDRPVLTDERPKVSIRMPDLRRLDLSGGSIGSVSGFRSTHDVKIVSSGGSSIDLDIEAGGMDMNVSGGGHLSGHVAFTDAGLTLTGGANVELAGMGSGTLKVHASGGSQLGLSGLTVRNAEVTMSGGSTAQMSVSDKLNVDLSGGSNLNYSGSPQIGRQSITGFSQLTHNQ